MTRYLLDTNVFIEAKNRYYSFDICPAFWGWLAAASKTKTVASIKPVFWELQQGDDWLAQWTKNHKKLFLRIDNATTKQCGQIISWAIDNYNQEAHNKFATSADSLLVSYALAHDYTVVTQEKPGKRKEIKIPDVCKKYGIRYMDTFQMLEREDVRFVLDR